MSSEFLSFLQLGFDHVTDLAGYDHMLFVVGLCAALAPEQWRKVLFLITAFTLGHCLTLLLSGHLGGVLPGSLIEQLVALSILLAGAGNLYWLNVDGTTRRNLPAYYILTFLFGLIHGLAFSNFFQALSFEADGIWQQLLAFNIGVEAGQLSTVIWFFLLYLLLRGLAGNWVSAKLFQYWWTMIVSTLVLIAGVYLLAERLF